VGETQAEAGSWGLLCFSLVTSLEKALKPPTAKAHLRPRVPALHFLVPYPCPQTMHPTVLASPREFSPELGTLGEVQTWAWRTVP
jgi:hypothetical protein